MKCLVTFSDGRWTVIRVSVDEPLQDLAKTLEAAQGCDSSRICSVELIGVYMP